MLKEFFAYNLHEYMQVLHNVFKGIAMETIYYYKLVLHGHW